MSVFGKKKPAPQKPQPPKPAPPPKKRKGFLRRAFSAAVKGAIGGALVFGSYQYYTPDQYKGYVHDRVIQVENALHLRTPPAAGTPPAEKLTFVFENKAAPVILGVQSQPLDNSQYDMPQKWVAMMGRQDMAMQNPDNAANFHKWLSQLDSVKNGTLAQKASAVDGLVDRDVKYQSDMITNKQADYWSSPIETLAKGKGDCEDFAILKYYALRYLGVAPERMFVIVVGNQPGVGINHATLLVNIAEPAKAAPPAQNDNILPAAADAQKANTAQNSPAPVHFVVIEDDDTPQGRLCIPEKLGYHAYYAMNETGIWTVPQKPKTPAAKKPAGPPVS